MLQVKFDLLVPETQYKFSILIMNTGVGQLLPSSYEVLLTSTIDYVMDPTLPRKLQGYPSANEVSNEDCDCSRIELSWRIETCGSRKTNFLISVYQSEDNLFKSFAFNQSLNTSEYDCFTDGLEFNHTFDNGRLQTNMYYVRL